MLKVGSGRRKEQKPADVKHVGSPKFQQNERSRGRGAPFYFAEGLLLNQRLRIEKMISGGGFGQIYKAMDEMHKKSVAIKVEPQDQDSQRIILEQMILFRLRGNPHIPLLIASNSLGKFNFIVMEMLGRNINDLRHMQPTPQFSIGTGLRIGLQMVEALRSVHSLDYVHRDVKPSNMCIGLDSKCRNVYLVDFGMVRRFRENNGTIRKQRNYAHFCGTLRYVSTTVHERGDQYPVDDFWSLFYSIVEICEGQLPWRDCTALGEDQTYVMKRKTPVEKLLSLVNLNLCTYFRVLPLKFKEFAIYLSMLTSESTIDYVHLVKVLKSCLPLDVNDDTPFDWENIPQVSFSVETSV